MRFFKNNLTAWHAVALAGMLVVFSVLTALIANAGLDQGADHGKRVVQVTLCTITGPLTGAISRGFQSCCLRCSLQVMQFCAPVLLIGILGQFVRTPASRGFDVLRLILWTAGWGIWFMGGLVSFAHALS
jgi:hypothetical protein